MALNHWYVRAIIDDTSLIFSQEPEEIAYVLEVVHGKLLTDARLSNAIKFEIKPKRQQTYQLLDRIGSYQGPDKETLAVLDNNSPSWILQPWLFWASSTDDVVSDLDAQVQVVRAYVRAKGDDA